LQQASPNLLAVPVDIQAVVIPLEERFTPK